MSSEDFEITLLSKKDCHAYKVAPPSGTVGFKAGEWDKCVWRGNLQVCSKGDVLVIKLKDASTGAIFVACPIPADQPLDRVVERTTDSTRYFVLRMSDKSGRKAMLGIGFDDRNDAFDFNACLNDFKVGLDNKAHGGSYRDDGGFAGNGAGRGSGSGRGRQFADMSLGEGKKISINLNVRKINPQTGGEAYQSTREHDFSTGGVGSGATKSYGVTSSGEVSAHETGSRAFLVPPPPKSAARVCDVVEDEEGNVIDIPKIEAPPVVDLLGIDSNSPASTKPADAEDHVKVSEPKDETVVHGQTTKSDDSLLVGKAQAVPVEPTAASSPSSKAAPSSPVSKTENMKESSQDSSAVPETTGSETPAEHSSSAVAMPESALDQDPKEPKDEP